MDDFYKNDNIDPDLRRNTAFQATNAVREALTLAKQSGIATTYEQALDHIYDLSPAAYDNIISQLESKNESEDVKYFKEVAKAEKISELILIDREINDLGVLIEKADEKEHLKKKLISLIAVKNYFKPRGITEHKTLSHDFYLAKRPYFDEAIYTDDSYKDYKLGKNHFLRLRLLHPDHAESILGADLIYEQFDLLKNKVRFVHLQYKSWNNNSFNFSDDRLLSQVNKMENHLCKGGYCQGKHGQNYTKRYRLPYCAGFLRPTSNKMSSTSKMISSGYHLPICELKKIAANSQKISKEELKDMSISHNIFEEAFVSRWISIDELEAFYKKTGLTSLSDTVRIHAQEVVGTTQEEIETKKRARTK